jgi:hypothetical protein
VYAARVLVRRFATLVLVIVSSCAPAGPRVGPAEVRVPAPGPGEPPEPRAARAPEIDYLANGVAAGVKRRTWLMRTGPARWTEDGPIATVAAPVELKPPIELPAIDERPGAVRVLVEGKGVRLLAWIDRASLGLATVAESELASAPDEPPPSGIGVRVTPGILLTEARRRGGWRLVEGHTRSLTFEGWLPDGTVGEVFERRAFEAAPSSGGSVKSGAVVVASPGGRTLARFDGAWETAWHVSASGVLDFPVAPEPGAPSGWQRIRFRDTARLGPDVPAVEVRGLVAAKDFSPTPPTSKREYGSSHVAYPKLHHPLRGTIAAGTPLFASDRRTRVGVTTEAVEVYFAYTGSEQHRAVQVDVPHLGLVEVEARNTAIRPEKD